MLTLNKPLLLWLEQHQFRREESGLGARMRDEQSLPLVALAPHLRPCWQRQMAQFQPQLEGLGAFFRFTALSVIRLYSICHAPLLDKKMHASSDDSISVNRP